MKPEIDATRFDDILFILFAEEYAKDSQSSIKFIMKTNNGVGNYISYFLPSLLNHITEEDIVRLFPPMEKTRLENFGGYSGLPDTWRYVSLGIGNHLVVRAKYYNVFAKHSKGMSPTKMHQSRYDRIKRIIIMLLGGYYG